MDIIEIRKRVLEALNINGETSFTDEELSQMLNKKRHNHHSDKIVDEDLKEDFDQKFIEFDKLYKEFTKAKVRDNKSKEVALISTELDLFQTKQDNVELEDIISRLNAELEKKNSKIGELENSILIVSRDSILKERESLINSIKPKKQNYFKILGIIASLTLGLNILTKFGNISDILSKSFNVNANYILLSLFTIISLTYIYSQIREFIAKTISREICTVSTIKKFVSKVRADFTEFDVYDFLEEYFKQRKGIKNWIYKKIFKAYNESTIETFKQIFILELLNKKVIRIGAVFDLEQKYMMIRQFVEKKENGEVILKEY